MKLVLMADKNGTIVLSYLQDLKLANLLFKIILFREELAIRSLFEAEVKKGVFLSLFNVFSSVFEPKNISFKCILSIKTLANK